MAVLRIVEPRPQDITNTIFRLPPFHYRNKGTFRCARGGNTADTPWKMLNKQPSFLPLKRINFLTSIRDTHLSTRSIFVCAN